MDGSGYPHGLVAEAIPVEARIVAVADTYDVLTSDRPYRRACSASEARRVVHEEAGSHLDQRVVAALMLALDKQAMFPGASKRSAGAEMGFAG
jgi:HD-GYP domain-containing protein (c-di-GMP phosphodiesterase class II)